MYRTSEIAGYLKWSHLEQVWRVDREHRTKTGQTTIETRYFVTNLSRGHFSPGQTLEVLRGHWQIENGCNWTADVIWDEDTKAWNTHGQAIQVLGLLRMMAYNLVTFLRSRYLRDKGQKRPWRFWCEEVFFMVLTGVDLQVQLIERLAAGI